MPVKEFDEILLLKKIQGLADEAEEKLIERWLSESEENMRTFTRMKSLWYALKVKGYSEDEALREPIADINARIDRLEAGRRRITGMRWLKIAAVVALLFGIGVVVMEVARFSKGPEMVLVENGINQGIKYIELPDGTKAWLNLGAKLSYPERFDAQERKVEIEGEVFLAVAKIKAKRFLAETPAFTVEVTGTSFNVNTNASGKVEVVLVEGAVNLLDNSGRKAGSLIPGQMAKAGPESESIEISQVNTGFYTAWKEGLVMLENAGLNEIVKKIEEVYGVEIVIDSLKARKDDTRYNFVFKKSQRFDTVFEMLQFVAPSREMHVKEKSGK